MAVQRSVDKWKMKKWLSIYAPQVFNGVEIGEMPANDEKSAIGRNITVSMDALTHNPSHAYSNVVLKVVDVNGGAAHTRLVLIEELYSYIRSLIRRYRSVADSVLQATTSDNVSVVLKMFAVTKSRTAHTKLMGIRKEMNEMAASFAGEHTANEVIAAVIDGKLQASMQARLHHITQINKVEIRKLEIAG